MMVERAHSPSGLQIAAILLGGSLKRIRTRWCFPLSLQLLANKLTKSEFESERQKRAGIVDDGLARCLVGLVGVRRASLLLVLVRSEFPNSRIGARRASTFLYRP
jgi:hypothetical protein